MTDYSKLIGMAVEKAAALEGLSNEIYAILHAVAEVDPALSISSVDRDAAGNPRAGFHYQQFGLAEAVDFWHADRSRIAAAFLKLRDQKWPGGLGIGLPPADIHLHVDSRQFAPDPKWHTACYWIETGQPDPKTGFPACVYEQNGEAAFTPFLESVKTIYGVKPMPDNAPQEQPATSPVVPAQKSNTAAFLGILTSILAVLPLHGSMTTAALLSAIIDFAEKHPELVGEIEAFAGHEIGVLKAKVENYFHPKAETAPAGQ